MPTHNGTGMLKLNGAQQRVRGESLLGGEPALRETMRAAADLSVFTANELADKLGLTAQATNNRLKQLVQIGALVRTAVVPPGGGREYRYRVPVPRNAAEDAPPAGLAPWPGA